MRGILRADPTNRADMASAIAEGIRLGGYLPETARAAQEKFSLERMIDGYEATIHEILNERRRA